MSFDIKKSLIVGGGGQFLETDNNNQTLEKDEKQLQIENRKSHCDELINLTTYENKVEFAKHRIKEFLLFCDEKYNKLNTPEHQREILVSFSGGKDSTVLLDLVIKVFQEMLDQQKIGMMYLVPAYAYEITFPETFSFINSIKQNYPQSFVKDVYFSKPKYPWFTILKDFGYPIYSKQISVLLNRVEKIKSKNNLSSWLFGFGTARFKISKDRLFLIDKRMRDWSEYEIENKEYFGNTINDKYYSYSEKCCNYIKGGLKSIKKPTFIGTMASESELRKQSWVKNGCNIINEKHEISRPLSIFTSTDIWRYIVSNRIKFNPKYGDKFKLNDTFNNICKTCSISSKEINNQIANQFPKHIKYSRLGCISCPYGSHLEKKENSNRFVTLLLESEPLYISNVIQNGMYKILIDMDIDIDEYNNNQGFLTNKETYEKHRKHYNELKKVRRQKIKEWYEKFDENLAELITQIENYKNYKNYDLTKKKNQKSVWIYTDEDLLKIHEKFELKTKYGMDFDKFKNLVYKNREEKYNAK